MAQDSIITEDDCGTDQGITLRAVMDGAEVIVSLEDRILGRTTAEDVMEPGTGDLIVPANTYLDEALSKRIDQAGVDKILVRSVLTCETRNGCCASCYGRDLSRGERVNIGEAVGVIAAQSIGEPGTQLTMRTFHIGGAAQVADQSGVEAAYDGKIVFREAQTVERTDGRIIVVGRHMEVDTVDEDGRVRQTFKASYGTQLFVKEGEMVKRGIKLADWDPFAQPVITEVTGTVRLDDIIDGITAREDTDEATGISSRMVVDWRSTAKTAELRPSVVVLGADGEPVTLPNGMPARYQLSAGAILSVADGDTVGPGETLARVMTGGAKTKDITGGLPRVAELFEARRPKDHAIIADNDGRVEFGRDYKNKRRIRVVPEEEGLEAMEYLIPKGKHLSIQEGDMIRRGDYLMDGNPAPQDILAVLGVEALADYLVEEIQKVYRLQGVPINDKHIEVIVRQMLQKVEISDGGETSLLKGETVEVMDFEDANTAARKAGRREAAGSPVLLGITKASLQTRSFISAASFQETTRVLTEASIQGKVDTLEGLKENVIVGRLIPAGTGGQLRRYRKLAADRDVKLKAQRAEAAAVMATPALPSPEAAE